MARATGVDARLAHVDLFSGIGGFPLALRECERFRTFSSYAWPIGLLRPTARVVFAGSNLEDLKAKEPKLFYA